MKKNLFYVAAILGLCLVLIGCSTNTNPGTNPDPAGSSGDTQATLPFPSEAAATTGSTPATAVLDPSPAGQAQQALNDLQTSLQTVDASLSSTAAQSAGTSLGSADTSQIEQALTDLQNSLQDTDVSTQASSGTSLDQALANLQATLQAQITP
jgi:hypothetical protein